MQKKTWIYILVFVLVAAATGFGIYYFNRSEPEEPIDLTTIAATADGVEIREADVTFMIEAMRKDYNGETLSDVEWATQLNNSDFTPESLREYVIKNQFAIPILVLKDAEAIGVLPDLAAIEAQITEQKTAIGVGTKWSDYLHTMGFADEAAYRLLLEAQNVVTPFFNAKFPNAEATLEETNEFLETYAPYVVGKRSSTVAVAIETNNPLEKAREQAVLAFGQLEAGGDFAEISDLYSSPSAELKSGGDMGWEALTQLPTEYTAALTDLAVGEYSGLVETEEYIYIILCTDEYQIEEGTFDPDAMPQDLRDEVLFALPDYISSSRPNNYYLSLLDSEKIVINPMPEGLPYDVDMSLAKSKEEQQAELGELEITDDVVGTGPEAKEGDTVRVTYMGFLEDGTMFDTSENSPTGYFEFTIGVSNVIDGWHQGLVGMRVGGVRVLKIPPYLAYGESGQGSIPGNATLIFQIELLSVNGDDGTTGSLGNSMAGTGFAPVNSLPTWTTKR